MKTANTRISCVEDEKLNHGFLKWFRKRFHPSDHPNMSIEDWERFQQDMHTAFEAGYQLSVWE